MFRENYLKTNDSIYSQSINEVQEEKREKKYILNRQECTEKLSFMHHIYIFLNKNSDYVLQQNETYIQ